MVEPAIALDVLSVAATFFVPDDIVVFDEPKPGDIPAFGE